MDFFEMLVGDVSVDLGGGDVGVTEQRLDGTEIGAVHKQIGGETMTESVGRDVLRDAGGTGVFLDDALNGAGGEAAEVARGVGVALVSTVAQEERGEAVAAGVQIGLDVVGGGLGNEDGAVFTSLAADHEFAAFKVDGVTVEAGELGDAETAGKEQLNDGAIAETGFGVGRDFGEQTLYFVIV